MFKYFIFDFNIFLPELKLYCLELDNNIIYNNYICQKDIVVVSLVNKEEM